MGGLIVLFIIGLWIFLVSKLATFLSRLLPANKFSPALKVLLFVLLLVMPFMDEIIGGFQFRALCKAETHIEYDKNKLVNMTVYSDLLDEVKIAGMAVPVSSQAWNYPNVETKELLLSYKVFDADGGWLSRWIDFNSVHQPYTFKGHCGPGWTKVDELFKNLNVTVIRKSSGK